MRLYILLLFILTSFSLKAQDTLSLDQIVEIALENNYSVKIAENDAEIAENNYTVGNAGFLPRIDILANRDFGVEDTEQKLTSGADQNRTGAKSNTFSLGADLNWTIFDGGRMFFNYERLEALQIQSEEELRFALESLIYEIQRSFYQAALEQERLELFNSNLDFSEVRLRISKDRYELGSASKLEYLQAQVDYNADQSAILQQLEVLAAEKYQLLNLMGKGRDSIDFILDYHLELATGLNFEELLDSYQSQNSQLKALRHNVEISNYDIDILKAQRYPSLDVYLGYNRLNLEAEVGFASRRTSRGYSYGLTARWNIFNGFNLSRQIENSNIASESAEYNLKQQELDIELRMRNIYLTYLNSLKLLDLEMQNLDVAKENNDIAQDRYRIGLSSPLELREAQVNLINAEIRYQNAAFSAKQAEMEIKFLAGNTIIGTLK